MKCKVSKEPESNPFDLVDLEKFSNENTRKIAKKIFESIYPKRKTPSPDKYEPSNKSGSQERQTSLTPIPLKYYRSPKNPEKTQGKVPRSSQNSFSIPKRPKICHQKVNSQQYPNLADDSYSKSPSLRPTSSNSMDLKYRSCVSKTPSVPKSSKSMEKNSYLELISQIASNSFIKVPFVNVGKEKRKVVKDKDEVIFLIKNIQNYGIFEGKVKDELIRYSNESRQELDGDRASIVGQIKSGVFDPNKNIIKIKTRIKRKLVKEF